MNILKTKVNSLEKEYPDVTSLIDIIQCITDKQNLEKKMEMLIKKIQGTSGLMTATVLNKKN